MKKLGTKKEKSIWALYHENENKRWVNQEFKRLVRELEAKMKKVRTK